METKNIFAKRLVDLREAKEISQQMLADSLGVTQQSLSRYEKGRRHPSIDFVVKAATFFSVSTDYLLGLSEMQSVDVDMQIVEKATGMNFCSVKTLDNLSKNGYKETVNWMLSSYSFEKIVIFVDAIKRHSMDGQHDEEVAFERFRATEEFSDMLEAIMNRAGYSS